MASELQFLVWSVYLGIFQILAATALATQQRGVAWNVGSRDAEPPPLHGLAARLDRALQNFKETFPFFIAAVLLVGVTKQSNSLTQTGAGLYFACRVLYVPIYAMGIQYFRTIVWCASLVGLLMIVVGACP